MQIQATTRFYTPKPFTELKLSAYEIGMSLYCLYKGENMFEFMKINPYYDLDTQNKLQEDNIKASKEAAKYPRLYSIVVLMVAIVKIPLSLLGLAISAVLDAFILTKIAITSICSGINQLFSPKEEEPQVSSGIDGTEDGPKTDHVLEEEGEENKLSSKEKNNPSITTRFEMDQQQSTPEPQQSPTVDDSAANHESQQPSNARLGMGQ